MNPFAYQSDVIERVSTHPASRIWELTPRSWTEGKAGENPLALPTFEAERAFLSKCGQRPTHSVWQQVNESPTQSRFVG